MNANRPAVRNADELERAVGKERSLDATAARINANAKQNDIPRHYGSSVCSRNSPMLFHVTKFLG
jgi:hypothetical protein